MNMQMILSLMGGIGLFLYGMNLLSSSLQQIAGGSLERTLERLTNSKLKAFLLGTGVTAVIQSSGATTIMLVGFVNAGIMKLVQAIPVMMGANIGTTVTAQILRLADVGGTGGSLLSLLKPSSFAPALVMIGAFVLLCSKKKKTRGIASIFVGFGILFVGMSTMEAALEPLKDSEQFMNLFVMFRNPFLAVLLGILVTTILQSSSASVGILQALASTGTVTFSMAAPIVIGQNIGKCVPVVLASIGTNKKAKRVVCVDILMNCITGVLFLVGIYGFQALAGFPFWGSVMSRGDIANFHSFFNIAMSLIMFPFTKALDRAAGRIIKDDAPSRMDTTLALLDPIFEKTPALALDQCKKVVQAMGETVQENLQMAIELSVRYDEKLFEKLEQNEMFLDKAETALGDYLVKVNAQSISKTENRLSSEMLHCVGDFERIGDHCINIAEVGQYNKEQNISFTVEGLRELKMLSDAATRILDITVNAFRNEDITAAYRVEPLEEVIDGIKEMLKNHHIDRLQNGTCGVQAGISFLEILTSMERISDHCSSIAIYVIQRISGDYFTDKHETAQRMHTGSSEEYRALFTYYKQQYYDPLKVLNEE
ncbi:MAG: Na/Pi cotransporter family protein [Lachnospiraceae bacterium]|nr:Na/Pi cotransporter family protein [Lachnospiraceae bacterium]